MFESSFRRILFLPTRRVPVQQPLRFLFDYFQRCLPLFQLGFITLIWPLAKASLKLFAFVSARAMTSFK